MSKASLLREPLLHFLVLGLLIFAADHYLRPASDERHIIRLDGAVENTLLAIFRDNQGREPTDAELSLLVDRWLQNEVYYREALTLGLDQGDEMIHSRLILKMREVILNKLDIPVPSDADLRAFLEAHRTIYDTPERFDFVQLHVSGGKEEADALITTIADTVPEGHADQLRSYQSRTRENIASTFGDDFAAGLIASREPGWRTVKSNAGWHIARLEAVHPAEPAVFDVIRANVRADWEIAQRTAAAFDAIKEMRQRYTIVEAGAKRLEAAMNAAAKSPPAKPDAGLAAAPVKTGAAQ